MRRRAHRVAGLAALALAGVPNLAAQALGGGGTAYAGMEVRSLRFERLAGIKYLRQVGIPFGVVLPAGRFSFDAGSAWVRTTMERADGTAHSVGAFTDTQVRGTAVVGREAMVFTVVVNLPTGPTAAPPRDYAVIGAISPSLFGFPVASYSSGFSITGGAAAVIPAGGWSIGVAGSVRVTRRYTPYTDATGPITYRPGAEARIRGGADRLLGSSRLSLGVTYSTFGDDQFGGASTVRGQYRPGPRWIGEAQLAAPVGAGTLSVGLWHFHRSAGDTTGASARNREDLTSGEVSLSLPVSARLDFTPALSVRRSDAEVGGGYLVGVEAGIHLRLSERVVFSPTVRYESGSLDDDRLVRGRISALVGSAFVRVFY
ncbi:MAG: hypothetical protein HOP28_00755 [Gemmatimonadales bacterium]|nr:hypothetical protein [Gemmatimonadales bacterium]